MKLVLDRSSPTLDRELKLPVVYTMGKVASSAVTGAIARAGRRCHDIHTLDQKTLLKLGQDSMAKGKYPPGHVCVSMAWQAEITDTSQCFYISMVRDPIARNLSAYFHNVPVAGKTEDAVQATIAAFQATYRHMNPVTWFDREFKQFLNIDIYSEPFDRARRSVMTNQFLLMRTDVDDAEKSRLLSRALGAEITVTPKGIGAKKNYARLYRAVEERIKFPAGFVDAMYSTKFARHFWTEKELNGFRHRWTSSHIDAVRP